MRKLATAAAVSLALASGGAFGLGLGEIEMQSALNQPMSAEIALTAVQPGELEGMIVQLASPEAYARAGIERSSTLLDLRFSVDESSGSPVIKVESTRPVVEPFLNFLLEVDWPQGRVVREYTVLLDPPVLLPPSASERNSSVDQAAIAQSGEAALVVPTPIERDTIAADGGVDVGLADLVDAPTEPVLSLDEATSDLPLGNDGELVTIGEQGDDNLLSGSAVITGAQGDLVTLTDPSVPNTDAQADRTQQAIDNIGLEVELLGSDTEVDNGVLSGADEDGSIIVSLDDLAQPATRNTEVVVGNGDTLFEIARDNVTGSASVEQMMMAILAANESSFINNNINLVRAGSILRLPDAQEATSLTQAEALAAISDQNQLWQDYRDSLRGTVATQVAQNTAFDADTTGGEETGAGDSAGSGQTQESIETAALDVDNELSEEARAILDNARQEILNREELRIVADDLPSDTAASATADETTDSDAADRVGEVNRRLQLAREELAATRLREEDLGEQVSELKDTTSNIDAMVSLRQNEVAALEAQLADAREAAEQRAIEVAEAEAAATDAVADAAESATDAVGDAADAATELAGSAVEGVQAGADEAQSATEDAMAAVDNATDAVVDSGTNALTEAGETLGEVELLSPDGDEVADAQTDDQTAAQTDSAEVAANTGDEARTWYQDFLDDPKRMAIAGIGGLGLLGVLGTLLFRRKRRDDDIDDAMLGSIDEAQFNDYSDSVPDVAAPESGSRLDGSAAFAAAGAAGAAGMAAAGSLGDKMDNAADGAFANEYDNTVALGASATSGLHSAEPDKDDTISEVDVYLAYGLHGQAEELLTKAVERQPENQAYASKLLQTYHAQGNGDAFHLVASNFHQRFGGEANPEWPAVAAMGAELRPNDELYASSMGVASSIDTVESDSPTLGQVDLPSSGVDATDGIASVDFAQPVDAADINSDDESNMMDSSIDPAFAFDMDDLELTGEFSAEAEEIIAEGAGDAIAEDNVGSIDFPDHSQPAAAVEKPAEDAPDAGMNDTMLFDDLDGLTQSVDDLTLDLDQLSSDLELDSAELLNADLSDLDIPDLTTDNELLLDTTGSFGESANDEMDTMLDLAKAYIDMGDKDSASNALGEIVKSGNPEQVTEAESLLRNIS